MSEYTPDTGEVRSFYGGGMFGGEGEFDRWLSEHDLEVARAERERSVQKLNKFIEELRSYAASVEEHGGDSSWQLEKVSAMYNAIQIINEDN